MLGVIDRWMYVWFFFFFQAEDGIRDLVRSRGLGDVYKRQGLYTSSDRNNTYLGARGFGRPGDYNTRILILLDLSLIHI